MSQLAYGSAGADRRNLVALLLSVVLLAAAAPLAALPPKYEIADLEALEAVFTDLAEDVRPSVVAIRCYQVRDPSKLGIMQVRLPVSQGSGLVIDSDGYIATNQHVIEDAHIVSVTLHNGMQFDDAELVQQDERSDLAVLKIDATGLKPVRFGNGAEVEVNQWAFACGNPFGLAYENEGASSITYGVISAVGRQMTRRLSADPQRRYYGFLLETSATINPGNSGGPLFNIHGEAIGIVVAIETSSGVSEGHGFAIPIDRNVRNVLDILHSGEQVRYGFLGIEVNDVEPFPSRRVADMNRARGARITRIAPPDGPAARANLQPEDIVIEFNGVPVESSDHLVRLVQFTPVGTEVEVTYLRKQVRRKTHVTLADRGELLGLARERE